MSCYTENVLFKKLIRVHENPVEDIDELKETLAMEEAPSVISMAPEEAENVDVEPEAVPEPDVTRTRLPRACKQAANTSQVPLKRRRRNN
ncbi:unnamed protein product [Caenorhabditis nigoni]